MSLPANSTNSSQARPRRPSGPPRTPTSPRLPNSPDAGSPVGSPTSPELPGTPSTPVPGFIPTQEILERRRTSKARDLLRKHYGMGLVPPVPSGKPNDPMDIDSPIFNAKAYYEQLITTSSLPVLLKRENDLLTEIRELDSERQSLVYNHHHELIAASDTISAMKSRAESLESDLEKLKTAFSEISRLTAQISSDYTTGVADSLEPDSTNT